MDSVCSSILDSSIDVAGICETWLTALNSPTTAIIKSYGYKIFHSFRTDRRGGGVAFIYKSCYSFIPFTVSKQFKSIEFSAASTKTATGTKVLFIIMYRIGQMTSLFNQELDYILSIAHPQCDCLVLTGDMNIHFDQMNISLYKQALEVLQSYGLERKVFEPTHIAGGSLDQIFTFSLHHQLECSISIDSSGVLRSDHYPVYCNLSLTFEKKHYEWIKYRKLRAIDNTIFAEELNNIIKNTDITKKSLGDLINELRTNCQSTLDYHAPLLSRKVSIVDTAPWLDKEYTQEY